MPLIMDVGQGVVWTEVLLNRIRVARASEYDPFTNLLAKKTERPREFLGKSVCAGFDDGFSAQVSLAPVPSSRVGS